MFSDGRSAVHKESNLFIPSYRDWLRSSVLCQSADSFVGYLQDHRYGPATVRAYLHSVEHFAHWMTKRRVPLRSIDELLVHRFVTEQRSAPGARTPSAGITW